MTTYSDFEQRQLDIESGLELDAATHRRGWTQPLCEPCFADLRPGIVPTCTLDAEVEKCCLCGEVTEDGIYEDMDPRKVDYPRSQYK